MRWPLWRPESWTWLSTVEKGEQFWAICEQCWAICEQFWAICERQLKGAIWKLVDEQFVSGNCTFCKRQLNPNENWDVSRNYSPVGTTVYLHLLYCGKCFLAASQEDHPQRGQRATHWATPNDSFSAYPAWRWVWLWRIVVARSRVMACWKFSPFTYRVIGNI